MTTHWLVIGIAVCVGIIIGIFIFAMAVGDTINDRNNRRAAVWRAGTTTVPEVRELARLEAGTALVPEVDGGHPVEPARRLLFSSEVRELAQLRDEAGWARVSFGLGMELLLGAVVIIVCTTLYASNHMPSWSDVNPFDADDSAPVQKHHPRHHDASPGLSAQLRQVTIVRTEPYVPGYDRDADFGSDWRSTGDGCDMRQYILRRDLVRETLDGCTVETGILHDTYTGRRIAFDHDDPMTVQIDHRYPLAAAWDYGASTWSQQRRLDFANDPRNLIAADGPANMAKSDNTPSEWLPDTDVCGYLRHYLKVAIRYDLSISRTDARTVRGATC